MKTILRVRQQQYKSNDKLFGYYVHTTWIPFE